MKRRTVRELHLSTSAIVEVVAAGSTIVITKRGTPVAEIRPFQPRTLSRGLPDREAWLARFPRVRGDSGRYMEEDR